LRRVDATPQGEVGVAVEGRRHVGGTECHSSRDPRRDAPRR
jgi:hypothetical protein